MSDECQYPVKGTLNQFISLIDDALKVGKGPMRNEGVAKMANVRNMLGTVLTGDECLFVS